MTSVLIAKLQAASESLASVQPHAPTVQSALVDAVAALVAQDALIDTLERELRETRADRDIAEARCRGLQDRLDARQSYEDAVAKASGL